MPRNWKQIGTSDAMLMGNSATLHSEHTKRPYLSLSELSSFSARRPHWQGRAHKEAPKRNRFHAYYNKIDSQTKK